MFVCTFVHMNAVLMATPLFATSVYNTMSHQSWQQWAISKWSEHKCYELCASWGEVTIRALIPLDAMMEPPLSVTVILATGAGISHWHVLHNNMHNLKAWTWKQLPSLLFWICLSFAWTHCLAVWMLLARPVCYVTCHICSFCFQSYKIISFYFVSIRQVTASSGKWEH